MVGARFCLSRFGQRKKNVLFIFGQRIILESSKQCFVQRRILVKTCGQRRRFIVKRVIGVWIYRGKLFIHVGYVSFL